MKGDKEKTCRVASPEGVHIHLNDLPILLDVLVNKASTGSIMGFSLL